MFAPVWTNPLRGNWFKSSFSPSCEQTRWRGRDIQGSKFKLRNNHSLRQAWANVRSYPRLGHRSLLGGDRPTETLASRDKPRECEGCRRHGTRDQKRGTDQLRPSQYDTVASSRRPHTALHHRSIRYVTPRAALHGRPAGEIRLRNFACPRRVSGQGRCWEFLPWCEITAVPQVRWKTNSWSLLKKHELPRRSLCPAASRMSC